jgi:transaldolase/glucose-6-phosphate isomerase
MTPAPAGRAVNPVLALQSFGQSVWLDYIRRDLLSSGELDRLVKNDGLRGLTSNPAIFEKAFAGTDYADAMVSAASRSRNPDVVYETLAFRDIRDAADALKPVHDATSGADGFVSLEVSPDLAHDTIGTLAEARRLWREVGRENLMVKVPGTRAGVPAIRELIAEGINVNVTLLFARSAYEAAAGAYTAGLESRVAGGKDIARVASVASFFVSRIDSAVDAELEKRIASSPSEEERQALARLTGKTAIANAKLAYESYRHRIEDPRWQKLARLGARPQRLLWASTSTKNPQYRDVVYVEELIGPQTVNTMPPATLDAFRDHGVPRASLERGPDEARAALAELARHGIRLDEVTARLLDEGVALFADAFAKLMAAIEARVRSIAA